MPPWDEGAGYARFRASPFCRTFGDVVKAVKFRDRAETRTVGSRGELEKVGRGEKRGEAVEVWIGNGPSLECFSL